MKVTNNSDNLVFKIIASITLLILLLFFSFTLSTKNENLSENKYLQSIPQKYKFIFAQNKYNDSLNNVYLVNNKYNKTLAIFPKISDPNIKKSNINIKLYYQLKRGNNYLAEAKTINLTNKEHSFYNFRGKKIALIEHPIPLVYLDSVYVKVDSWDTLFSPQKNKIRILDRELPAYKSGKKLTPSVYKLLFSKLLKKNNIAFSPSKILKDNHSIYEVIPVQTKESLKKNSLTLLKIDNLDGFWAAINKKKKNAIYYSSISGSGIGGKKVKKLLETHISNNTFNASNLFDYQKLANYYAILSLFGVQQNTLYFILNSKTNLLEPYFMNFENGVRVMLTTYIKHLYNSLNKVAKPEYVDKLLEDNAEELEFLNPILRKEFIEQVFHPHNLYYNQKIISNEIERIEKGM